jgi:hypothetical protein
MHRTAGCEGMPGPAPRGLVRSRLGLLLLAACGSAAFARMGTALETQPGDALPSVPSGWSSQNPSAADLATPYGQLYQAVARESDPTVTGSLVESLTSSAQNLGIPALP